MLCKWYIHVCFSSTGALWNLWDWSIITAISAVSCCQDTAGRTISIYKNTIKYHIVLSEDSCMIVWHFFSHLKSKEINVCSRSYLASWFSLRPPLATQFHPMSGRRVKLFNFFTDHFFVKRYSHRTTMACEFELRVRSHQRHGQYSGLSSFWDDNAPWN